MTDYPSRFFSFTRWTHIALCLPTNSTPTQRRTLSFFRLGMLMTKGAGSNFGYKDCCGGQLGASVDWPLSARDLCTSFGEDPHYPTRGTHMYSGSANAVRRSRGFAVDSPPPRVSSRRSLSHLRSSLVYKMAPSWYKLLFAPHRFPGNRFTGFPSQPFLCQPSQ